MWDLDIFRGFALRRVDALLGELRRALERSTGADRQALLARVRDAEACRARLLQEPELDHRSGERPELTHSIEREGLLSAMLH